MDPSLFPRGELPMKRVSLENGDNNHSIAGTYFALAHRARRVDGPPRWLVTLGVAPNDLLKFLFDGSAQIIPLTDTLAFNKVLTPDNYLGIAKPTIHPLEEHVGESVLELCYMALSNKRQ